MKTALVLSGHLRTLDRCLANQHWHVYRHFPDADFFVSTVKDADFGKLDALTTRYGFDRVKVHAVEAQPDCVAEMRVLGVKLPESWVKGQPYTHEPYSISVHPQAVLRQLWQLNAAWEAFPQLGDYECIVRTRPDLWFQAQLNDRLWDLERDDAWVPAWGEFGGINDRFAVMGDNAARAYFTTYSRVQMLMENGAPLHPETLVRASLDYCGATVIKHSRMIFATLRSNGEFRQPEISAADLLMR